MVLDIILPILVELFIDPIKNYVVSPIKRHVSYAFKSSSKVQELQVEVEQLQNKKDRLQQSADDATRNGDGIFPNVTKWLTTAENDIREADQIIQGKEEAKNKCFFGFCPSLKTRYQLSKIVDKKALAIRKLRNEEGLDSVSFQLPLQQIVVPSVYSREALPSRMLMLNQVMDALKDPNLNMIGVYGMGGVGKTTLAKEVHAKALQEKLFENVVMVAVSQAPEMRRIQGEIADFLGIKLSAEEIPGRASQIHKALEKSKVLIILDDLWQRLDLNGVGIPSQGTSTENRCKIMLTSRNRDLLSNEMRAQKVLSLEALEEEETLSLFQMSVAEAKDPEFQAIATQIAKKCAGLPLLIQIVATELTNKESFEWNNKLNQLSAFGDEEIYEKVYKVLESSYENLPGKEIKSFFLLCALFGQSNIQIHYLLAHSMGLGLFRRIRTVEAARDNLFTWINKLKDKSLLLDGDMAGFVKIHDVVRDTALSIASREQHAFVGEGEVRFVDWPDKDCTRISLQFCNASKLPVGLDYPEVELFLLFTEDLSLNIPDSFFVGMKKLKVVDIRGTRMVSLPSSIGLLTNLQTLCLHKCRLDNAAVLGELKQLELLSFAGSDIVELPRKVEALTQLKLLDMRDCSNLQVIPASVLSKLCSLEELYVVNSFVRWGSEGNASLMELESLSHLLTLEIEIVDPKMIPIGFKCFGRLRRYKISIGHDWDWKGQYERSRTLKLKVEEDADLEDATQSLLLETEDLYLDGVTGIQSIFYDGFPKLKSMDIANDSRIQHLIKSTTQASFPVLESLYLHKLQSMEKICWGQPGMGSFEKLKILNIHYCDKMKSLFSLSDAKCLQQLQELIVTNCDEMEAVVEGSEVIEFTQLSSLKLSFLKGLIGFSKINDGTEQMGLLFNNMVCFPNLTSLEVVRCESLKNIFTASLVKCLMKLKNLAIRGCALVEEIIESKKMEEEDSTETVVFPKLEALSLDGLPNLKRFCSFYSIEFPLLREFSIGGSNAMENLVGRAQGNEMVCFPNLTSLEVEGFMSLKYIFTASVAKCLMQLRNLSVRDCDLVEEIIQSKKMDEIDEKESTKTIVFPKLEYLRLRELRKLKSFCSYFSIDFPLLRELRLEECNTMENFVGRDSSSEHVREEYLFNEMVTFSNLETLHIYVMDSIKYVWDEQFIADDSFFKLKSIQIIACSKLSVVFPSKVCTRFQRLETLLLYDCETVEEIYQRMDFKEINNSFSLRELIIKYLPSLNHIWNKESEWGAFSTFPNLQSVLVLLCKDLKYVFPASMGCGLLKLQQLHLCDCNQLEVMIAKEKDDETSSPSFFQFPELTKLTLFDLKKMRSFYGRRHTLDCPKLKILDIRGCPNISIQKFIFNCEDMSMDEQSFHAIHQCSDFSVELCTKLKKVTLVSFDEGASGTIVFGFLSQIKALETLVLSFCFMEETLGLEYTLDQRPIGDEQRHGLRVRHLELQRLQNLKHVIKKNSQYLQHLQTLNIEWCFDMKSIAPSSTCLQNLTTLHMEECNNVTNLVTASTAKTMVNLIDMKVLNCKMIEEIVAKDADDTEHDEIIFNKLQYLELTSLPNFNSFCSYKHTFCFPLLEQVTIEECPGMNIFCGGVISTPKLRGILFEDAKKWEGNLNDTISSQAKKWVGEHLKEGRLLLKLESLELVKNTFSSKAISANHIQFLNQLSDMTVRDCESIQVVFDLEGGTERLLPKFKKLKLINLPMLTQLCNAPKGILCFNKLEVLKIDNCSRLEYALTWSMASCLSGLYHLEVKNCEMMETLIVDDKDVAAIAIFNKLENLVLENMPKLSSIYSGSGDLESPSLQTITIMECLSLKALFISTDKVFFNFKKLSMDIKSMKGMMQLVAPVNLFSNFKSLEVSHCSATATSIASLVRFVSRSPNLDKIKLRDSSFKGLFNINSEKAMVTMPMIKSLTLEDLDDLNKICWHASLFPSLKTLKVGWCGNLVNFPSSSASFENLIILQVYGCHQLMNFITPSMARKMGQLKQLKVYNCKMLTEIVGDGIDQTTDEIVLANLETLKLINLQSLQSFSLTRYNFEFPCLDEVILRDCPNLRIFCDGIVKTPMLNCVKDSKHADGYWEGDLNTTTKHLYQNMEGFEGVKEIKLSDFPVLKEKWDARCDVNILSNLERLEVDNCELFSNAIPSHIFRFLSKLKVLIVEKCDSVEQVIDLEGVKKKYGGHQMRNLEELQLIDLPRLKQVWSKDPRQISSYKYLQILNVHNCCSLTFICNLSIALSLRNLRHMEVINCSRVEHIIMIAEEETMQKYETIFPSLNSMTLLHLTHLLSFCSTSGVVECTSLKKVEVVDCPNLELFASTFSEGQHSSTTVEEKSESVSIEDSIAAFLGNKIVIPELEDLKVEWRAFKDEFIGNYQSGLFSRLKCIEFAGFQSEEYAFLPPTSLYRFVKLEKLAVSDSYIEEINFDDMSVHMEKNPESLALLTELKLSKLTNLKHLVRHDFQSVTLFQNLVALEVAECSNLEILVPPSVAFLNLTYLEVSKCDGLLSLISASTARSLTQLRRMILKDCIMMREIVATASDGEEYEIRFSQLEYMEFDGLPSITCFSSGNYNFGFPSLGKVVITDCPNMKNFAERVSINPKLRKMKTGRREYEWEWEGSLNDTIQALYMEKDADEKPSKNNS